MNNADESNSSREELLQRVRELERDIKLLQATIDGQRDTLIFSIDHDYKYRSFNEAFKAATAFAYGTEVANGMSIFDSITKEDDREKARLNIDSAMRGESHVTIEEFGSIHPLVYETRYNPIRNSSQDRIIGVSVLSANVTERVLFEQRIKTLNTELESFTYTAAHDLKVPLRLIDGYARILAEDYGAKIDQEGHRLIGIINQQATHMARLIDDLLNFSKLGKATITVAETSILDIVRQAADEAIIHNSTDQLKIRIGEIHPCRCDATMIRVVFQNLISNAVKFSSTRPAPLVEIGSELHGTMVTYFVKDNGVGFDMTYSSKLFGLFQRLHKQTDFEGTGVGLAIVQRIVGKHGGKVWFQAEPDKGATFFLSLQAC